MWWGDVLGRFEGELALLGDADEDDALGVSEPRAMPSGNVVLTLATLELNDRYQMRSGKGSDGVDEPIV